MTPEELEGTHGEVEAALERALPETRPDPGRVREAMRYAVLGPGKRLRPLITLGACGASGGDWRTALPAATAIELLHAYTLVHDDLPAMDNDAMRRGRPTVHVAFGVANAILVGDALQAAAFGALAPLGSQAVAVLAERAGAAWLIEGQARDIGERPATIADLEAIHAGKTGALFSAAAELGALAAGADAATRNRLRRWGMVLGIAFQHADDLDDGDHKDLAVQARARLAELRAEMAELLTPLGERGLALQAIALRIA